MSHFANDVHHRISTRIGEIIPDFVESEYPAFVSFVTAYYEFLEQYDDLPTTSTYESVPGVVTVQTGNSTIIGGNTQFANTSIYANNVQIRVGSDQFRIRSIANNTSLTVYELPIRSYFANTHTVETNRSIRQASGAARQILSIHDVDHTLDDFIAYFRDTYLRNIPEGLTDTATLLPRILDFYQAKGSEQSYRFLFRSVFDKEIEFSYPRDSVFTTSDNEYVKPILLRMGYAYANSVTGNVALLETREIIGLTSNARATVLRSSVTREGAQRVVRMSISEPIISREVGGLLLEDGTQLLATKFGIPPEGLASEVYTYSLVQELVKSTTFVAGETISTIPTNDPNAITGQLLGSITGFTINQRGSQYQIGDLIYPPARYANGAPFTGGFGAVGRIAAFTDVDLTEININDPGLGYYVGLPLVVDNTGTGGGSGLAGYVSEVTPGNILLHYDGTAGIADGDTLTFVDNGSEYTAEREAIDYYQVGISLSDLFGGLSLNDALTPENDGDDLVDETEGRQLLQESAIQLDASSWSAVIGSAIYGANLQSTIIGLISSLSTYPIYVNGVRTEIGEIRAIQVESFGSGYVAGLPTVAVQTPVVPTKDEDGTDPLTYREIFGDEFDIADISVSKDIGQIGQVDVLTGGTGYSNVAFTVNSTTSTTQLGNNAQLGMTLGALSYGIPYFKNTRSFASADQYLQDITKYQPFSYILTVEESLTRYADIVRQLVHPAGGLLLPRQTITTELDLVSTITFGGIDLSIVVREDPTADPPSLYTITVTAPGAVLYASINRTTSTAEMTVVNANVLVETPVTVSATTNTLTLRNEEETEHLVIPTATNTLVLSNEEETEHLVIPTASNTLTLRNEEEIWHSQIPLAASTNITVTAPVVLLAASVSVSVTFDTYISARGEDAILPYDGEELLTAVNWNAGTIEITAPPASV
jgi:hypothetical protein